MKDDFGLSESSLPDPSSADSADIKEVREVQLWLEDLQAAEKLEDKWRKSGNEVIRLYEADHKLAYQFNILYSNTETLAPALYSTTPTPVVQRRFKDEDPIGLEVSKVIKRVLEYTLDDGQAVYADFDTLMMSAVQSALVPGRGVTRFKYDAEIVNDPPPKPEDSDDIQDKLAETFPGTIEKEVSSGAQIKWESVCGEQIPWDRFCHGYGRYWQEVPWVAYKWPMTREELVKNFGNIGALVSISSVSSKELETEKSHSEDMMKGMKIAWVYEIWNKVTREVVFISEGYRMGLLKKVPDPLGLTGFFNCAEPLTYFQRVSSLLPQTLYAFYEEQAKELNQVTARIGRLIKALKVRGIYDGSIDALERIFEEDDNALIAADNTSAMYDRGGIEKAIWMLPIDKIIIVLQQLYAARQQTKQVIYEVTGLSDILRGASNPNETLGAQQIKNQWGSLRLRKLQKNTQTYVVDCLRIMAEIACSKFSQSTIQGMTNLQYPTQQQKDAIQQTLPTVQDPQQQQMMQETLQIPSWEDILKVMQNDIQRAYRIDIETNSTIEPEATEDRDSMTALMNALSQFLLGVQPLVADGSLPFDAMKAMMLTICRRFNFGDEVEDELKKMQAPQPPEQKPSPEQEAQAKQLEQGQQQLTQAQQKVQQDQAKLAQDQMQLQYDQQQAQMEIEFQQKSAQQQVEYDKKEAMLTVKAQHQEADMKVKQVAMHEQMKLDVHTTKAALDHTAKEASLNQASQSLQEKQTKDTVEPKKSATSAMVDSVRSGQSELAAAVTTMAKSMEQFVQAHRAEKTITDNTGKSYKISTAPTPEPGEQ